jgi:hypothetical protein
MPRLPSIHRQGGIMTHPTDIGILARTAYETGIDPVDYATGHVIGPWIDRHLGVRMMLADIGRGGEAAVTTASVACRILGDLLDAGWTPPEVTR